MHKKQKINHFQKNAHFYLFMCKKKYTFAQNFDN